MSLVPVEHIGRARALLRRLAVADAEVKAALRPTMAPLIARRSGGGKVPYAMMNEAVAQWCATMPHYGRLAHDVRRVSGGYDVTDLRAAAGRWSYAPWGDGAAEEGIRMLRITMTLRRDRADLDVCPVAAIGMHALARRIQRGRPAHDDAVLADLLPFDREHAQSAEFRYTTPSGGAWLGRLAATCDGPALLVPMAQTYADSGMLPAWRPQMMEINT